MNMVINCSDYTAGHCNWPALQTCNAETRDQSLGQEDPLEKEMATHSSILAWKIPWREESGGLGGL